MNRSHRIAIIAIFALLITTMPASPLRANVYEWEWVDENDHELGKQASTTVCPGRYRS